MMDTNITKETLVGLREERTDLKIKEVASICGIGALHIRAKPDKELLTNLIKESEIRGQDSTGIYHWKRKVDKGSCIKKQLPASEFVKQKFYEDIELSQGDLVLWCCRAHPMTEISSQTEAGIQPVNYSNFYAVHSGAIPNAEELATQHKAKYDSKLDSEALPMLLRHYGSSPETITRLTESLSGGFSYLIHDSVLTTLIALRNFKPLVGFEWKKNLYFLSEWAIAKKYIPKSELLQPGANVHELLPA